MKKIIIAFAVWVFGLNIVHGQIFYAGTLPGKATATRSGNGFVLKNSVLQTRFSFAGQHFSQIKFGNIIAHEDYNFLPANYFYLALKDGTIVLAADFRVIDKPVIKEIAGKSGAVKLSEKENGKELSAILYNKSLKITLRWKAILKDNSNYIQQSFSFKEDGTASKIDKIYLINFFASGSLQKPGIVDGH